MSRYTFMGPEDLSVAYEEEILCTRSGFAGERIGAACGKCGHTNVVHPGTHNPQLTVCLVCVLLDNIKVWQDVQALKGLDDDGRH